jgi:hypothetical protein
MIKVVRKSQRRQIFRYGGGDTLVLCLICMKECSSCSFGLLATNQRYFALRQYWKNGYLYRFITLIYAGY